MLRVQVTTWPVTWQDQVGELSTTIDVNSDGSVSVTVTTTPFGNPCEPFVAPASVKVTDDPKVVVAGPALVMERSAACATEGMKHSAAPINDRSDPVKYDCAFTSIL